MLSLNFYTILHAKKPTFLPPRTFGSVVLRREDFDHVANAWATDLEHAYTMTNTIEQGWWRNVGVRYFGALAGTRSTSVGDVIGLEGRWWMVAAVGFTEVEMVEGSGAAPACAGGAA